MNAERLNIIALSLRREFDSRDAAGQLSALVSACQQIGQNPGNPSVQQNFVSSRAGFYKAVTNTPSDTFTPAWRQILVDIGGEGLFGKNLKEHVERILAENQSTLSVAYAQLNGILTRLQKFRESLTRLTDAFTELHIGSEKLAPGEAEIGLFIPRKEVRDRLIDFADELNEIEFVLNTLSEVATGQKDDLTIRTMSSSGLTVFLAASPVFAAIIAKAVDLVVGEYKKILEIKKLQLEIERLQLPSDISESTKAYANTVMESGVEKFAVEIMNEFYNGKDEGRKNELRTAVRISLNRIANRIDRGFNFEVRIEPPAAPGSDTEGVTKAVQTIRAATENIQYMKLEGPPILALPEGVESGDLGDVRHKKKGGSKKEG